MITARFVITYFQIGDGIILLLAALVKSKFDVSKYGFDDFLDFWIFGTLICGFEYTKLL